MASGAGVSLHHTKVREPHHGKIPDTFHHVHREVYFARYIDWALTTPLLLIDLSLLAGLNGATIFTAVIADIIMILSGLFAAFGVNKTQKWGWCVFSTSPSKLYADHSHRYAIGCLAYIWILYTLIITARSTANAKGAKVARFYTLITVYTLVLWTAYPVFWAIADGRRILSVDGEIIAYAVLDVLAKGVFGAWLLFTHKSLPETHVDVGGFWTNGLNSEGTIRIQEDEDGA